MSFSQHAQKWLMVSPYVVGLYLSPQVPTVSPISNIPRHKMETSLEFEKVICWVLCEQNKLFWNLKIPNSLEFDISYSCFGFWTSTTCHVFIVRKTGKPIPKFQVAFSGGDRYRETQLQLQTIPGIELLCETSAQTARAVCQKQWSWVNRILVQCCLQLICACKVSQQFN